MKKKDLKMFNAILQGWHQKNKEQLTLLGIGTAPVFVEGNKETEKMEITGDILKGVRLGALLALEVIGELPYQVEEA